MSKVQPSHNDSNTHDPSITLKGTFIAVMSVGVFVVITWFLAYALFLSR